MKKKASSKDFFKIQKDQNNGNKSRRSKKFIVNNVIMDQLQNESEEYEEESSVERQKESYVSKYPEMSDVELYDKIRFLLNPSEKMILKEGYGQRQKLEEIYTRINNRCQQLLKINKTESLKQNNFFPQASQREAVCSNCGHSVKRSKRKVRTYFIEQVEYLEGDSSESDQGQSDEERKSKSLHSIARQLRSTRRNLRKR